MDPITAAILAVVPAFAADTVKSGVKDAYEGLKAVIRRKWGDSAPLSKAIAAVEEDPKSKAQAGVLEEKVVGPRGPGSRGGAGAEGAARTDEGTRRRQCACCERSTGY